MATGLVLTAAATAAWLADHPRWQLADGALVRELTFADFRAAFAFMTRVAALADAADHHPDWSNSWNRVVIKLSSHDVGGLTPRDLALAEEIDRLVPDPK